MHEGKMCTPQTECSGKCHLKDAMFLGMATFTHTQACLKKNTKTVYNYNRLSDGSECFEKASVKKKEQRARVVE